MGHGARSAVAFVSLLQQAGIELLVDVRAYPASRRHPHFARAPLARWLASAAIAYDWQGSALGGMRAQGYLAHMQTPEFERAARALIATGATRRLCLMCAETEPADCHRAHIADWLVAHGTRVVHLITEDQSREHSALLF